MLEIQVIKFLRSMYLLYVFKHFKILQNILGYFNSGKTFSTTMSTHEQPESLVEITSFYCLLDCISHC